MGDDEQQFVVMWWSGLRMLQADELGNAEISAVGELRCIRMWGGLVAHGAI
jgi:hypothetical protein